MELLVILLVGAILNGAVLYSCRRKNTIGGVLWRWLTGTVMPEIMLATGASLRSATQPPGPKVNWAHVREMELDLEGMVYHDLQGNLLDEPLTRAEVESVARLARMERGVEQGTVSRDRYRAEKARAAVIRQQGMDELAEDDKDAEWYLPSYVTPQDVASMTMGEYRALRDKMMGSSSRRKGIFG